MAKMENFDKNRYVRDEISGTKFKFLAKIQRKSVLSCCTAEFMQENFQKF